MSSRSGDTGLSSQISGKLRQENQETISSLSYIARRRERGGGGRREEEWDREKMKRERERGRKYREDKRRNGKKEKREVLREVMGGFHCLQLFLPSLLCYRRELRTTGECDYRIMPPRCPFLMP